MNASTALRTALAWLHNRLQPPSPRTDWVEYSKQMAWRSTPRLLPPPPQAQPPSTYEPPQKTTDPARAAIQAGGGSALHMPTGVWRKTYLARMANPEPTEKLPSVKGLHTPRFYKMPSPEEVQADKFLLDVEPESESALDQLAQLAVTDVKLKAVRARHESRGKAS